MESADEVAPMTEVPSKASNVWMNEDEEEDDDFDESVSLGCMARYVYSPIVWEWAKNPETFPTGEITSLKEITLPPINSGICDVHWSR